MLGGKHVLLAFSRSVVHTGCVASPHATDGDPCLAFKAFRFAALAAFLALALVGTSSARAESTLLCSTDPSSACTAKTHLHETTSSKAKLLTSAGTIECSVLFLGDAGSLGSPLLVEGKFTYSSCSSFCTVTEEGGASFLKFLKTAHEKASVTVESEIHVKCAFINCTYSETLEGTAKGPLLSSAETGEVSFSNQELTEVEGSLCLEEVLLDSTTTGLTATYIGDVAPKKASTSLTTSLKGGGKEGAEITVTEGTKVKDTATLSGENASKAGGTVTYKVYSDASCKELVTKAGEVTVKEGKVPDSEEKELEAGAIYYWQAEYSGDSSNEPSTSTCSK